jgi:hypothetical protein
MEEEELLLWMNITKKAEHYFEYGIGGSTIMAITQLQVKHVSAVDSDLSWIQYINTLLQHSGLDSKLSQEISIRHVDIGETSKWGYPINNASQDLWPSYAGAIASLPTASDVIFIDGRFRVACTLAVLLNCPSTSLIMLHDVGTKRKYYEAILSYVNIIAQAGSLIVFQRRESVDLDGLIVEWERYRFDPRM